MTYATWQQPMGYIVRENVRPGIDNSGSRPTRQETVTTVYQHVPFVCCSSYRLADSYTTGLPLEKKLPTSGFATCW